MTLEFVLNLRDQLKTARLMCARSCRSSRPKRTSEKKPSKRITKSSG